MHLPRIAAILAVLASGLTAVAQTPAQAAAVSFTTTGVAHSWTVPTGVEVAQFIVNGGAGAAGTGSGQGSGGAGGTGAAFAASMAVTPGETLDIGIGANATSSVGAASGLSHGQGGSGGSADTPVAGGGGGATVIKAGAAVLLVAGGGGGGGSASALRGSSSGGQGGSGGVVTAYGLPQASPGGNGSSSNGSRFEGIGGSGGGGAAGTGGDGDFNVGVPCGGGGGGAGLQGGTAGGALSTFDPDEAYGCGGGGGGSSSVDATRGAGMSLFSDSALLASAGQVTIKTIDITSTSLTSAIVGTPYSASMAATSNLTTSSSSTTTTWSVTPALPTGLSLNTATGAISGSASVASSATYTFTVTTSDVAGVMARTSRALTLTVVGAPTITSINPPNGAVAGGTSIMIDGTNLADASSVTFGGTAATITANTNSRVTVTQPAGSGIVAVAVTTPGGTATSSYTYGIPTITSVAPTSGPANGGVSVQVNGTNLTYATGVTFGGIAGTVTSVTDTRVTVLSPESSVSGAVDVVVTSQGASPVTSAGAFTYTAVAPSAPSGVTAAAGDGAATVRFTAPANGGSAITSYRVTSSPGGITATGAVSPITVTGLTNGTAYTFTVTATNAVGTSNASSASVAVTPAASGTGGGGAGSSTPTPAPTATASTAIVTASSPSSSGSMVTQRSAASVPGLRLPSRITAPGTTILVRSTLRTADGTPVRARARVAAMSARSLGQPRPLGARIVYGKRGRVSVVTDGHRAIVVTLTLTAPETATSLALRETRRWNVPAER